MLFHLLGAITFPKEQLKGLKVGNIYWTIAIIWPSAVFQILILNGFKCNYLLDIVLTKTLSLKAGLGNRLCFRLAESTFSKALTLHQYGEGGVSLASASY